MASPSTADKRHNDLIDKPSSDNGSPPASELDKTYNGTYTTDDYSKELSTYPTADKLQQGNVTTPTHRPHRPATKPLAHDEVAFALRSDFHTLSYSQKALELIRYTWRFLSDREPLIYLMGIAFISMFMGYGAVSSLLTIRIGSLGSWILAVLYAVYCVTAIFSPLFVNRIGAENGLLIASLGYLFFCASFFYNAEWINYLAAIVTGFSAGILWSCNGAILTTLSTPATRASNTGIFQFMYRSAGFTTGLVIGSVQSALPTQTDQLYLWTGLCAGGSAFFICFWIGYRLRVRRLRREAAELVREVEGTAPDIELNRAPDGQEVVELKFTAEADGWVDRLVKVWQLTISKEFRYFTGWLIFMQGMSQAWVQGGYNRVISFGAGTDWYGWILAMDGGFAMGASFATGAWFEYLRRTNPKGFRQPVYVGFFLLYLGLGLSIYTIHYQSTETTLKKGVAVNPEWTWFVLLASITSLLWNIGFAMVETSIFVYIVSFFPTRGEIAFASKIAQETFGWTLGFCIVPGLNGSTATDLSHYIYFPVILMTINAASFLYFLRWRVPDLPDIYKIHANTATVVLNVTHEESVNSANAISDADGHGIDHTLTNEQYEKQHESQGQAVDLERAFNHTGNNQHQSTLGGGLAVAPS